MEAEERIPFALSQSDHPYVQFDNFSFYIPKYGELSSKAQAGRLIEQLQLLQESPSSAARWKQQQLMHELLLLFQAEDEGIQQQHPHYAIAERTASYLRTHYKEPVSYQQLSDAMHFHQNYISICMKNIRLHAPGVSDAASDRASKALADPHQRADRTHSRGIRVRLVSIFHSLLCSLYRI